MSERQAAEVQIQRDFADNPTVAEIKKRNVNVLRATVLGLARIREEKLSRQREADRPASGTGTSAGESKALLNDPISVLMQSGQVVAPPFDLLTLAVMPENSTELGPCIDAMAVNVEGFGWRLESRVPVNERTPVEVLQILEEEQVIAENFFSNCCPDGESLEDLRDKLRRDLEATGNCYVEFVEVPGTGRLDGLNHLPSWTMRIGRVEQESTEYVDLGVEKMVRFVELPPEPKESTEVPELADEEFSADEDGISGPPLRHVQEAEGEPIRIQKQSTFETQVTYELREQVRFKRFRRYVQLRERQVIWFKELGDPRLISNRDGHVVTREELLREENGGEQLQRFTLLGDRVTVALGIRGFPVRDAANPVRHKRLYSTRSPYGLPRYTGHLFSIFGSRAAEEINFTTFKNNNVPSMVITVSNGKMDDESVERIEEFVEATIAGDDNYSKFLLLEAEPVLEGMRDPGSMRIDVKPLTSEQHTDAMFVNYQNSNDERVRRAWRFPPIFVGKSDDFTGKTIEASRKLADEQVFGPERGKVDRFLTRDVLLRIGVVWSVFRSNSPNVTENADLVKLLAQGEKTGGLTPRIARRLIGRIVNEDLGEIDTDLLPPDQPFSLTLAAIMKTNSATEAPGGGEPTSQGRAGLQVAGPPKESIAESADDGEVFSSLAGMIRAEAAMRFGGFVPPALKDEPEEVEPD